MGDDKASWFVVLFFWFSLVSSYAYTFYFLRAESTYRLPYHKPLKMNVLIITTLGSSVKCTVFKSV